MSLTNTLADSRTILVQACQCLWLVTPNGL